MVKKLDKRELTGDKACRSRRARGLLERALRDMQNTLAATADADQRRALRETTGQCWKAMTDLDGRLPKGLKPTRH